MAEKVQVKVSIVTDDKDVNVLKSKLSKALSGVIGDDMVKGASLIGQSLKTGVVKNLENVYSRIRNILGKTFNVKVSGEVKEAKVGVPKLPKEEEKKKGEEASKGGNKLLAGVASIAAGIFGIITQLKPVRIILDAIGNMFQLIFLPIGLILMAFLAPVLMGLASIISSKTFQGILTQVIKFVTFMFTISPTIIKGIGAVFKEVFTPAVNILRATYDIFRSDIVQIIGYVNALNSIVHNGLGELGNFILSLPVRIYNYFVGLFNDLVKNFVSGIVGVFSGFANKLNPVSWFSSLPHLANGGAIVSGGLAVLHSGETVVPANQSFGGHTFNITINGSNSMQSPKDFANQVMLEIEKRTGRLQRW